MTWLTIVFFIVAFLFTLLTMFAFFAGIMIGFRLRHDLPPVELPFTAPAVAPAPTPSQQAAEDEEAKTMVQLWAAANEGDIGLAFGVENGVSQSKFNIMA